MFQEVKLQNNMKDEEIKALRDRMIKMESIIPVQVRPGPVLVPVPVPPSNRVVLFYRMTLMMKRRGGLPRGWRKRRGRGRRRRGRRATPPGSRRCG